MTLSTSPQALLQPLRPVIINGGPLRDDDQLLHGLYAPPKGLEGIHTNVILRILSAVVESQAGLFLNTDEEVTGKSFVTFVRRLFGVCVLGDNPKGRRLVYGRPCRKPFISWTIKKGGK